MVIVIEDTMLVFNIPPFHLKVLPMFFSNSSIAKFRTKAYDKWANVTLSMIFVGVLGERSTKIGSSSSNLGVKVL